MVELHPLAIVVVVVIIVNAKIKVMQKGCINTIQN